MRELLQPAAKERQREAGEQFGKGAKLSADRREPIATPADPQSSPDFRGTLTLTVQRGSNLPAYITPGSTFARLGWVAAVDQVRADLR